MSWNGYVYAYVNICLVWLYVWYVPLWSLESLSPQPLQTSSKQSGKRPFIRNPTPLETLSLWQTWHFLKGEIIQFIHYIFSPIHVKITQKNKSRACQPQNWPPIAIVKGIHAALKNGHPCIQGKLSKCCMVGRLLSFLGQPIFRG